MNPSKILLIFVLIFAGALQGCREGILDKKRPIHDWNEIANGYGELQKELAPTDFKVLSDGLLYVSSYCEQGMPDGDRRWTQVCWLNDMTPRQIIVTGHMIRLHEIQAAIDGDEGRNEKHRLMLEGQRKEIRGIIERYSMVSKTSEPHEPTKAR